MRCAENKVRVLLKSNRERASAIELSVDESHLENQRKCFSTASFAKTMRRSMASLLWESSFQSAQCAVALSTQKLRDLLPTGLAVTMMTAASISRAPISACSKRFQGSGKEAQDEAK